MTVVDHVATMPPVNIFVGALDEASDGTDDQNTSHQIVKGFNELNDLLHRKKASIHRGPLSRGMLSSSNTPI
jgi:hypothetical protein